jgi:predicted amidohydrolase YtcJ
MDRAIPGVEALAISNGKILALGEQDDVMRYRGRDTGVVDLEGKALLPGFIDSHSHLTFTAIKRGLVAMDPPPAGDIRSIEDILDRFGDALATRSLGSKRWLVGWGYDHAMLEEKRHPTRADLDRVSTEIPIMLVHFSTHQIVANSKALERAEISSTTENPPGGVIRRDGKSGEPNGIIEEKAMFPVLSAASRDARGGTQSEEGGSSFDFGIAASEIPGLLEETLGHYAAAGFTTAFEGAATPRELDLLRALEADGRVPIDVVVYPVSWAASATELRGLLDEQRVRDEQVEDAPRVRVAGGKMILDGGSPGRTAFLREPYHQQLPGESGYRGYPAVEDSAVVKALVADYYQRDVPLIVHALGDAAVDQAIEAITAVELADPGVERRTQLIHVQQAQPDQLARLAELDVTITFQVAHNFYFGDFHEEVIYGPARTSRLNPAREAIDLGVSVTIHHDSPVHPVDQILLIWSAVNRVTRSGRVIGSEQRISVMEALEASTIEAAYQIFEEDRKGSLRPGKLADLVVLDRNPLEIDPMEIRNIGVVETYKEGRRIYQRD